MGEMRVMRDQQLKARAQFIANMICRYCASASLFSASIGGAPEVPGAPRPGAPKWNNG